MIIRNSLTCERTDHGFRYNFRQRSAFNESGMGWDTPEQRLNLALNMLDHVIPDEPQIPLMKGSVSALAFALAPRFVDQMLAYLPYDGVVFDIETLTLWIETRGEGWFVAEAHFEPACVHA